MIEYIYRKVMTIMKQLDTFMASDSYYGTADYIDLAHWFILKEPMSQKKVQKLCYYAQAWSLAFNGCDIVQGIQFEAWPHGPVCRPLWNTLHRFGWRRITINDEMIDQIKKDNPFAFSEDQTEVLNFVWENYGDIEPDDLENITHNEKPWRVTRGNLGPFEKSNKVIPNELMRDYYYKVYNGEE